MSRRGKLGVVLAVGTFVALWVHNVPTAASEEDRHYAERFLLAAGLSGRLNEFGNLSEFENQVRAIQSVQWAVLDVAGRNTEVPFDREREPKDVFELKRGLCFDRSRAIEKILTVLGFNVRHVAVYAVEGQSRLGALLRPGNPSHALTEVRTAKGWMLIDPNVKWIGLTGDGEPVGVSRLRTIDAGSIRWRGEGAARPDPIFAKPFTYVLGLYSRHGRFYPPYSPIPDVNWWQLFGNLTD